MDKPRIAWDTCVFIDAIQAQAARSDAGFIGPHEMGVAKSIEAWSEIEPMLLAAETGNIEIIVSEVCVAEVCHLRRLENMGMSPEVAMDLLSESFDMGYVVRAPAGRSESALASELRRSHSLSTCDAIIAATASLHGASSLYTRDGLPANSKRRRAKNATLLSIDGLLPCRSKTGGKMCVREPNAAQFMDAPLWMKNEPEG